jgi:integrase
LAQALEFGRKRGLIDTNPSKDANRPRSRRSKPFAPRAAEVRELLTVEAANDPEIGVAGLVLAATGMRRGELLALRWTDVDLERAEVSVEAALVDGGPGVGVVRKPTKRSDWREVPLTAGAVSALKGQCERRQALFGVLPAADEYVFCAGFDGQTPLRPDRLTDRWTTARGASAITIQHLRHFAATTMLDAGESYRTVADILGNSENTLRLHYDGRTDLGKRRAIAALEFE